jgi:hypothetical protein
VQLEANQREIKANRTEIFDDAPLIQHNLAVQIYSVMQLLVSQK